MAGIDIQPEGINLIQLKRYKRKFLLQKIAYLPLPPTIFTGVNGVNWNNLTAILFDWVRELDLVGAVTAAAISAQRVRFLYLESMLDVSESTVRARLEQVFPGLGVSLAMDYCHLHRPAAPGVIVAATKKDYMENYLACLSDAGLCIKIMDIDLFSIRRAMNCYVDAVLWQQRQTFTLIWQGNKQLPQHLQWPATSGEQAIAELTQRLEQRQITQILFCGSSYYVDLFSKTTSLATVDIRYFSHEFNCPERNLADYLLAMGLAMREVPAW